LDARENLTASVGYIGSNWSVVAYGQNLTDEEYEIFIPISTLFAAGSVNNPRTYGVTFEYDFQRK
ncbi:MAG TPA: hypothetical protein VIZ30_07575, partial [Pseudomonadales bacterium]